MSTQYEKLQANPIYPIPIPGVPTALQPVVNDIEADVENDAIGCGERYAKKLEIDIQHAEDVARAKLRRNAMAQLVEENTQKSKSDKTSQTDDNTQQTTKRSNICGKSTLS